MKKIWIGLLLINGLIMAKTPKLEFDRINTSFLQSELQKNPIWAETKYNREFYFSDTIETITQNPFFQNMYSIKLKSGAELVVDESLERQQLDTVKKGDKIDFIARGYKIGIFNNLEIQDFIIVKINEKTLDKFKIINYNK